MSAARGGASFTTQCRAKFAISEDERHSLLLYGDSMDCGCFNEVPFHLLLITYTYPRRLVEVVLNYTCV